MSHNWNSVYDSRGDRELSWYEAEPVTSLALLDHLGVTPSQSVIDVGGGRSNLVDHLRGRGFGDLSVLDLSASALADVGGRQGLDHVATIETDVTRWHPARHYDVWHDRATLHFIDPDLAVHYVDALRRAFSPSGALVIGVFAPDGPATCSGLRVTRYDAEDLATLLGPQVEVVEERRVRHVTPWGTTQSFQWIAARLRVEASPLSAARGADST